MIDAAPSPLHESHEQLRIRLLSALMQLGVQIAGRHDDPLRWSASDLVTDLVPLLLPAFHQTVPPAGPVIVDLGEIRTGQAIHLVPGVVYQWSEIPAESKRSEEL